MLSGTVFDIQRFALHDGPGIRTTVFVKGCPLRCKWCHNPESQSHHIQYSFDYDTCRMCINGGGSCPLGVRMLTKEEIVADNVIYVKGQRLVHDRQKVQAAALPLCTHGAVTKLGEQMSVEKVIQEVLKDKDYYDASGGGLTISGGEPMAQFDFTLSLAREAQAQGIHVCLDTSGHAPQAKYTEIAPYVDLFLFDYKETDAEQHKAFTGVSNELLLNNLEHLYDLHANIILRCPLVPGINDTSHHLQGIAELAQKYPRIQAVNVMAYHNMGNYKAERIGQQAELSHIPTVDEETKDAWMTELRELGCERVSFG